MDSVIEKNMVKIMAQPRGIGVIYRNLSISRKAKYVSAVKRFENGIVYYPITLNCNDNVKISDAGLSQSRLQFLKIKNESPNYINNH